VARAAAARAAETEVVARAAGADLAKVVGMVLAETRKRLRERQVTGAVANWYSKSKTR
jgi:fructose-specific component phosphotransferase system IIB-like protein